MTLLTLQQCREVMAELAEVLPAALSPRLSLPEGFPALPLLPLHLRPRGRHEPVFVGGGIVPLLITDASAPPVSRTKDIDVVLEIAGYEEFVAMEHQLQRAGFRRHLLEDAPVFRWWWREVMVDFMPDRPNHLVMNANRWFRPLAESAERSEILPGRHIWRASATCFLATKFEAFRSRGGGDFLGSKDMEDIIAVVDGRAELAVELDRAPVEAGRFVMANAGLLLDNSSFMECLPRLVADRGREAVVTRRLTAIAQWANRAD